jgi:cytochrome c oxidase subunit III
MSSHAASASQMPLEGVPRQAGHSPALAHHFNDLTQQRQAAELGMWLFLVTEFMFFGGLFLAYLVYRRWYPAEFAAGSHTMDGTVNTAVLLTSSLTMALAVAAAERGRQRAVAGLLAATLALGVVFLAVKAYEYHHKYEHGHIPFANLPFEYAGTQAYRGIATFFNLYFLMTGMHAFHMVLGMIMLAILIIAALGERLTAERSIVVHNIGLYWHFVDLVWVYLFPFFYLVAARGT